MKRKPVVVCTNYRGVFFGYAGDTSGERLTLSDARMCVYWVKSLRGVMGLAAVGPCAGCRIGPSVSSIELRGITAIFDVSDCAVAAWEAGPWG